MYKLILMDYSMPWCDGPTSTVKIRQLLTNPCKEDSPYICFLTAYSNKENLVRAIESGGDKFLVKPVFKKQIHRVLIDANLIR